jgi:hypothetical protein
LLPFDKGSDGLAELASIHGAASARFLLGDEKI